MSCTRVADDHCCYLAGEPCRFVADAGAGEDPRWVCTLRLFLGSWDAVHADPRYMEHVRPKLDAMAIDGVADCNDWPPPGVTCATCGTVGVDALW